MNISLLTYNVLFNKAVPELKNLITSAHPDIICLQEVETDEENLEELETNGYLLADSSNSFIKFGKIFGLATYYNPKTVSLITSQSFDLPRSLLEGLLVILRGGNNPRSVLKTEFLIKDSGKKMAVYNIHLTAWGSNGARLKQMAETFEYVELQSSGHEPLIIAGDFNFSYGRKKLEEIIRYYNLKEATNTLLYTFESKLLGFIPLKLKLDYILYNQHVSFIETKKIALRHSDHFPILAYFKI